MSSLKQSSTAQPLMFFMVQSSDNSTPYTSSTSGYTLPTVTLSKNGAAFGANAAGSGGVSEVGSGWFKVAGNATDTGTLGPLALHATATNAVPSDAMYDVVAFDPQDGVRLGLTALPNAVAGANGGLPLGNASGRVDLGNWLGSAPSALISGRVDANIAAALAAVPPTTPAAGSYDEALKALRVLVVSTGHAAAGSTTTVTLDASGSVTNDYYVGCLIWIYNGPGFGQGARVITAYNGTTKVATLEPLRPWVTAPTSASFYNIAALPGVLMDADLGVSAYGVTGDVVGKVLGDGASALIDVGVLANISDSGLQDIADAVLDEDMDTHLGPNTSGNMLYRVQTAAVRAYGPNTQGTQFTIYRGDDYYVMDNRALEALEPTIPSDYWPDLTGATVQFTVQNRDGSWVNGGEATKVNAGTPGAQKVRGVPDRTETLAMESGTRAYRFIATLATTGHVVTLVDGLATVKDEAVMPL
jgi:hypothetical protein